MATTNTIPQSANLVDILAGFSQNLDANRQYYDSRSDKYMADIDKYTGKIQDVRTADYARQVLQQQDQDTKQFQQDYLKTLASEGQKNRDAQEVTLKTLSDTLKKFTGGTGGVGGPKGDKPNQDIQSNSVDNNTAWNYLTDRNAYLMNPFTTMMSPYPGLGAEGFKTGMYYQPQKPTGINWPTDQGTNLSGKELFDTVMNNLYGKGGSLAPNMDVFKPRPFDPRDYIRNQ